MKEVDGLTYIDKVQIKKKDIALYRNADGFIEGYYGTGKLTEFYGGVRDWSGDIKRIVTNETDMVKACEFITAALKTKPRVKEILPTIIFPE